jgi:hypothetical protein
LIPLCEEALRAGCDEPKKNLNARTNVRLAVPQRWKVSLERCSGIESGAPSVHAAGARAQPRLRASRRSRTPGTRLRQERRTLARRTLTPAGQRPHATRGGVALNLLSLSPFLRGPPLPRPSRVSATSLDRVPARPRPAGPTRPGGTNAAARAPLRGPSPFQKTPARSRTPSGRAEFGRRFGKTFKP